MAFEDLNQFMVVDTRRRQRVRTSDIDGTFYRPDLLGTNALRYFISAEAETSVTTVPTGTTFGSTLTCNIRPAIVTSPQLWFSLYVNTDDDATMLWPNGSGLTSATRPRVHWSQNLALSDFTIGKYVYSFSIKNESAGNQDYYLHVKLLIPLVGASKASAA